jgi:hypothetical protein
MSEKPYKRLAIDLLACARRGPQHARDTAIRAHHRLEAAAASNPRLGRQMQEAAAAGAARGAYIRQRPTLRDVVERCERMLKDAAKIITGHLGGNHALAAPPTTAAPARYPEPESRQPAPSGPSPRF